MNIFNQAHEKVANKSMKKIKKSDINLVLKHPELLSKYSFDPFKIPQSYKYT